MTKNISFRNSAFGYISSALAGAAANCSEAFLSENPALFKSRTEKPLFCGTKFCVLAHNAIRRKVRASANNSRS